MRMRPAQHQRQTDYQAEIEARAEELEQQARETLNRMKTFEYPMKVRWGVMSDDRAEAFDVIEGVTGIGEAELIAALKQLDDDPEKAAQSLKASRDKAVEDILGRIDFEAVAEAERELNDREAA